MTQLPGLTFREGAWFSFCLSQGHDMHSILWPGFIMYPWLAWDAICRPGWLWTCLSPSMSWDYRHQWPPDSARLTLIWGNSLPSYLLFPSSAVLAVSKLLSKTQHGWCADSEGPLLHTSISCSHVSQSPWLKTSSLEVFLISRFQCWYGFVSVLTSLEQTLGLYLAC